MTIVLSIVVIISALFMIVTVLLQSSNNKGLGAIAGEITQNMNKAQAASVGVSSPVKYFFIGAMPAFMRRRLLSPSGMSEKLGSLRCSFVSKKERYFSLMSLRPVHSIAMPL